MRHPPPPPHKAHKHPQHPVHTLRAPFPNANALCLPEHFLLSYTESQLPIAAPLSSSQKPPTLSNTRQHPPITNAPSSPCLVSVPASINISHSAQGVREARSGMISGENSRPILAPLITQSSVATSTNIRARSCLSLSNWGLGIDRHPH
ncbi:hypothetical protein M405DRAFT_870084 [Rhizopogon salebrosus TDB-379]|nr:hypothetical protein M405DRAFT_870084 [Rhizopogon salebrosus TDB-379]